MKYIHLLVYLLLFQFSDLKSQNYQPYPEDSLFFEVSIGGGNLMTLVKNGDTEDIFQPVNNYDRLKDLPIYGDFNYDGQFPYRSWLGKTSYQDNKIQFITVFDDTLAIDLNKNLAEADTFSLSIHSRNVYNYGQLIFEGKVEVRYDAKVYENGDSIKEYRFAYLNTDNQAYNLGSEFGVSDAVSNVPDYVFRIAKNGGIIETPDFNYFPYCKQYKRKGKITDFLDLSTSHAYKVFQNNAGDKIHTKKYYQTLATKTTSAIKIVTNQTYNPIEKSVTTDYDFWTHIWDNGPLGSNIETNFEQITETIDFNDYSGLQKAIPDGMGAFYRTEGKTFITYGDLIDSDSIQVSFSDDLSTYSTGYSFFRESLGGRYYYHQSNSTVNNYTPTYSNINGIISGTPFTESFILNIEEATPEDLSISQAWETISINNTQGIQNARIYNTNGQFVQYIKGPELNKPIDISNYSPGVYLLICWDGKQALPLKFIK